MLTKTFDRFYDFLESQEKTRQISTTIFKQYTRRKHGWNFADVGKVSKIWLKVYQGKENLKLVLCFRSCLMISRFMLDGKKVYKSAMVCPFGILMGRKRRLS